MSQENWPVLQQLIRNEPCEGFTLYPSLRGPAYSSRWPVSHEVWSVQEDRPECRTPFVGESWPAGPPLIVMAIPASPEFMQAAVRAGATFYVLQEASDAAGLLVSGSSQRHRASSRVPDPLTPRQRDVLRRVALGQGTKEIAYELRLSPKTVAAHRAHIMERLGIRDLAALVIYALQQGIVDIGEYGDPPGVVARQERR